MIESEKKATATVTRRERESRTWERDAACPISTG
jgi:hypothetical protein